MANDDFKDLGFVADEGDDLGFVPESSQSDRGVLESFARGGAQGASMGFADEITGAGEAVLKSLLSGSRDSGKLLDDYRASRNESRQAYSEAAEANPRATLAGNIAGGVAGVAIPGAAMGKGGAALTRLLTSPATSVGKAAAVGGGLGAVTGLGTSEADLTKGELGEAASDTLNSGLVGGGLGMLIPTLGPKVLGTLGAGGGYMLTDSDASTTDKLLNTGLGLAAGVGIGRANQKSGTTVNYLDKLDDFLSGTKVSETAADLFKAGVQGKNYTTKGGAEAVEEGIKTTAADVGTTLKDTVRKASKLQGEILESGVSDDLKVTYRDALTKKRDEISNIMPIGTEQETTKKQALDLLDELILGVESKETQFVPKGKIATPSKEDKIRLDLAKKKAELQAKNAALGNNREVGDIEKVYNPETGTEVLRMNETGPGSPTTASKIVRDDATILKDLSKLTNKEEALAYLNKLSTEERAKAKLLGFDFDAEDIVSGVDEETGLNTLSMRASKDTGKKSGPKEVAYSKAFPDEPAPFTPVKSIKETIPGEEEVLASHAKAFTPEEEPLFTPLQKIITNFRTGGKETLTTREAKDLELNLRGLANRSGKDGALPGVLRDATNIIKTNLEETLPEVTRNTFKNARKTQAAGVNLSDEISPDLLTPFHKPEDITRDVMKFIHNMSNESGITKADKVALEAKIARLGESSPDVAKKLGQQLNDAIQETQRLTATNRRIDIAGTTGATKTFLGGTLNPASNLLGLGVGKGIRGTKAAVEWTKSATPDAIKETAAALRAKLGPKADGLATILGNMAEKDQRGRNALLFTILQNKDYKQMLGITDKDTE